MLNYLDVGTGEEIVFIHGLGNRIQAWAPQLELTTQYRLIIIELRGHGDSPEKENINVEFFAKDIIEVLDYLNIEKAHFVGLSLGGIVALEICKRFKKRVKSLILCNTTYYIPTLLGNITLEKTKRFLKKSSLEQLNERLIKKCLYNPEEQKVYELAKNAFHIREDTYLKSVQSAFGRNYFYDLLTINVPTLIIGSLEDKVVPIQNAYLMHYMIKSSNLIIFENTGHLSNIERPELFNLAIAQHIKQFQNKVS
ncbi:MULTISPECIES: alpha/beta fold hydrolase [Ureibacillus]|jgi:3-oxoadipate enol-lactonase|uniref:Pimeloyl-ACP methyl ester carboxylesterase n=1 Tax=Ureibacillus thermosphaericus TaxID=51173 RepID=A0A840PQR3_URETH|nr:alpha/beta hydrolase [Ureibacillus thermosphaericus]MBB5148839.1 pimeloyl-ACP methyl ester carboxylesterase [Ureibacillus thermosphaericus]NKZ31615.1 alpha/beta hydrolase [Ureibacillus thermosphaericus]